MQNPFVNKLQLMAALLALAICVDGAYAQGRRGQGGQRGGFGGQRGGFGGQRGGFGGQRGGGGMNKTSLLRSEVVQKDLKMTEGQMERIQKEQEAQREEMRSMFSNLRDLSEDERTKRFEELRNKGRESEKKVLGVLSEAQQQRLGEIFVQVRGVSALLSDDVAEQLELTDDQKTKIREALDSGRQGFDRELFASLRDLSREERDAKMAEMRKEGEEKRAAAEKKAVAVLNEIQTDLWALMSGEKFDVDAYRESQRRSFGGRGQGGPGGDRRRGGDRGGDRPGRPERPGRPGSDN